MKKITLLILFVGFSNFLFGQIKSSIDTDELHLKAARNPVEFTHIPFLLVKFKPTSGIGYNNTFQIGAELVPPAGKFTFNFDYGIGKGSWNLNKYVRQNQAGNSNRYMAGEIRMYFSDWYPFYALDKKPFGRYYAIEYFNGSYNHALSVASGLGGTTLPAYAQFEDKQVLEKNQGINFKFGRHFHITSWLFIDGYVGLGLGKFTSNIVNEEITDVKTVPLHYSFLSNKTVHEPGTQGLFFNKTAGFRLAFVL